MKKAKQYEIDSFEKLVNVINKDNFEFLTVDLIMWLGYVIQFVDNIRKSEPKYCKGKSNWELCKVTLIWIDDGKNDMKELVLKNHLTGQIQTFQLNSKPQ